LAVALIIINRLGWEGTNCLLETFVNYDRKKVFYHCPLKSGLLHSSRDCLPWENTLFYLTSLSVRKEEEKLMISTSELRRFVSRRRRTHQVRTTHFDSGHCLIGERDI